VDGVLPRKIAADVCWSNLERTLVQRSISISVSPGLLRGERAADARDRECEVAICDGSAPDFDFRFGALGSTREAKAYSMQAKTMLAKVGSIRRA
jgi:hypothetical protein